MSSGPLYIAAARADLRVIALFIARDNPDRAISFVAELRAHCARIALQPGIHRTRDEYDPGIRVAVHGRYLIFHRIRDDGRCGFERIIQGARDLLGPDQT